MKIYVALLGEGLDVWRPVDAIWLKNNLYQIISENPNPGDEIWEFASGDIVHCRERRLSSEICLVTFEKIIQ
jgi:hypothetical protein